MNRQVSHSFEDESMEAKTLWFSSLSLQERMEILCTFTDLALENNPNLPDMRDDKQTDRRVQILSAA